MPVPFRCDRHHAIERDDDGDISASDPLSPGFRGRKGGRRYPFKNNALSRD